MKSRTEKWARYRAEIKNTPEAKFPKRKEIIEDASAKDIELIASSTKAQGSISSSGAKKAKGTSYSVYTKRKRAEIIIKAVVTVVAIIGFVLLWFLWVRG